MHGLILASESVKHEDPHARSELLEMLNPFLVEGHLVRIKIVACP
jgi:hypothetical protein